MKKVNVVKSISGPYNDGNDVLVSFSDGSKILYPILDEPWNCPVSKIEAYYTDLCNTITSRLK
jgi:hypothetical protein